MPTLWFDLDEMDDDDELYNEELEEEEIEKNPLADIEEDIYCVECGALVEDGFQCEVCGLVVEVTNGKQKRK